MTESKRSTALSFAIGLALLSLGLLVTRSGLLALLGLLGGIGMAYKAWKRPGPTDVTWIACGLALWCGLWGISMGLVYYGWESGEVVVIRPVDPDSGTTSELRVWVVDDDVTGGPIVFYDGPRDLVASIGNQSVLEWERDGATHRSRPVLHWMDEASPEMVQRITALYDDKYGHLDWATNAFFLLGGRAPGRAVGILELGERVSE